MARSVTDCALFLDTMSRFDPRYPISYPADPQPYVEAVERATPRGLRIAYTPDMDGQCEVDPEVRGHIEAALAKMSGAGATVEAANVKLDGLKRAYLVQRGLLWATLMRDIAPEIRAGFKPTVESNIQYGLALTMDDIVDSQRIRSRIYDDMLKLFTHHDVLASPVVGCMPHPVETEWVREINGKPLNHYMDWLSFAFLATAAGLPAISVPVGLGPRGLPVGLQLVGAPRGESALLAAARAVEMVFGGPMPVIDPKGA
jgi:amidase